MSLPQAAASPIPVYRSYLSGGPEALRWPLPGQVLILAVAMLMPAIWAVRRDLPEPINWQWALGLTAASISWAAILAAIVARWVGGHIGTLSGLTLLTSLQLCCPDRLDLSSIWAAVVLLGGIGFFALGNVGGRLPLVDARWTAWGFYSAAGVALLLDGPAGPAFLVATAILVILLGGDSRGIYFFLEPIGLAILGMFLFAWVISGNAVAGLGGVLGVLQTIAEPRLMPGDVLRSAAVGAMPWTPLALVAAVAALRQGHYASPFGRLCACWLIAPLVLATLGLTGDGLYVAFVLPGLTLLAALGIQGLWVWYRRRC